MADFEGAKKLNFEDENASTEEWDRLYRDLQLERDKLVKKLDKKKNELENEKTNTTVFRQYVEDLKNKIKILEKDKETLQVINPARFDPGPTLTGEIVERENNEIETLKSEISSMKTKLVLANQNLEIARGEINHFEKLVPELKLELSKMENECKRLSTSTNDRYILQQLLNDKTTETETLKTKMQDLSTTNKHYLSQLQRKDFTIETTTNKFDKERQQILEQANQMETNLREQLITAKEELDEKCVALKGDKRVFEIQVDVLHVQIGELSEERDKWQRQVAELEATVTGLQVQLQKLGEVQQNETEIMKKYEQHITELTNQITILTAVKENAAISQKLVGKLNQDIKVLETNNKQTQGQFQMELTESKRHKEDLERKLGEMARDLTDRDRKIRELTQPAAIQQGMGRVSKSPSTPVLYDPVDSQGEASGIPVSKVQSSEDCGFAPTHDDQSIATQSRPPMIKAHTFNAPTDSQYPNQSPIPLFQYQYQERHLMRPSSFQTQPGLQPHGAYPPQRFPNEYAQGTNRGRSLPDQPTQEQRGPVNPSGLPPRPFIGNYFPTAKRPPEPTHQPLSPTHRPHMKRGISATQEESSGIPVSKVQSPLNIATEATKVILLWSKERPTLERELNYFDSSQDVVSLIWADERSLYQGNGTLTVGKHHGSLMFPSTGDMVQVQPFEVSRKPMGMLRVKLKLNDPQAQENVKVENLDTGGAERNSDQIEKMQAEIQELIVNNNNNIKSEQNMGQVSKSPSTPILGPDPKHSRGKDKSQSKGKDSKSKYPSTGASNVELTPQLVPQPNKTVKSPSKITFRGANIHVVKLKAFPNMTECVSKQVICTINKHYELGQLMCIAELATKVGLRKVVAKYAGIKLCNLVGNCDGAYKGTRYFDCPPNYGMFVPLEDVYVHVS